MSPTPERRKAKRRPSTGDAATAKADRFDHTSPEASVLLAAHAEYVTATAIAWSARRRRNAALEALAAAARDGVK